MVTLSRFSTLTILAGAVKFNAAPYATIFWSQGPVVPQTQRPLFSLLNMHRYLRI